jgi:DNA-binding Xre family transcriptional regulator
MAKTKQIDTWDWFVERYQELGYKSLNQFAIATGFQKSSLSRYFHKQRQMPVNTLVAVCRALKIKPEELLVALNEWKR